MKLTRKIEDLRWMIANRANKLWSEGIKSDPLLEFDRVKVALENLIEEHFMVPNMWEPGFVETVSIDAIDWLLDTADVEEIVYEINSFHSF